MENTNGKKVAWNASQGIINEISNRRTMANTYFINGNIKKAFNTLMAMKQSTIQSFEDDERIKLKEIETTFYRLYGALATTMAMSFNQKDKELFNSANKLAQQVYSRYNDLLMDLLGDRGYLVGEQSDASSMRF